MILTKGTWIYYWQDRSDYETYGLKLYDWMLKGINIPNPKLGYITRVGKDQIVISTFRATHDGNIVPRGTGRRIKTEWVVGIAVPPINLIGDPTFRNSKKPPRIKIPCKYCSKWHFSTSFSTMMFCEIKYAPPPWLPQGSREPCNLNMWSWIEGQMLIRDSQTCQWCKKTISEARAELPPGYANQPIEVHHIIPRRDKGRDHPHNLITLCWQCHNTTKGGWYEIKIAMNDGTLPGTPEFYADRDRASEIKRINEITRTAQTMDTYWASLEPARQ